VSTADPTDDPILKEAWDGYMRDNGDT